MVNYSKMSDAEIKEDREKSRKDDENDHKVFVLKNE